jgi:hypothetical protein
MPWSRNERDYVTALARHHALAMAGRKRVARGLRGDLGDAARARSKADAHPDAKGGYLVTLPHGVVDRLKHLRGPGESYSDMIARVARGCASLTPRPRQCGHLRAASQGRPHLIALVNDFRRPPDGALSGNYILDVGTVAEKSAAGAPEKEIEVTPEMNAAGARVLWRHCFSDEHWDAAAPEVYREMARVAPH